MDADSEVLFKEKREEKGVKAETAVGDATLRFDFRALTPATPPPGRGAEARGGDGEEQLRVELKKFSLRPEKYDGKGDFKGRVNQFEEYATLGQWNEKEKASLLFLSLTAERECTSSDCRSGRIWCTLPGSRPSAVGLDKKRTPALLYRSWPDLGEGKTRQTWNVTRATKKDTSRGSARLEVLTRYFGRLCSVEGGAL